MVVDRRASTTRIGRQTPLVGVVEESSTHVGNAEASLQPRRTTGDSAENVWRGMALSWRPALAPFVASTD